MIFDKLVQVLVFGCAYERIADGAARKPERARWTSSKAVHQALHGRGRRQHSAGDGGRTGQSSHDSPLLEKLKACGLASAISEKGKPAPLRAAKRWVVERRTYSWSYAYKKLLWAFGNRCPSVTFVYPSR